MSSCVAAQSAARHAATTPTCDSAMMVRRQRWGSSPIEAVSTEKVPLASRRVIERAWSGARVGCRWAMRGCVDERRRIRANGGYAGHTPRTAEAVVDMPRGRDRPWIRCLDMLGRTGRRISASGLLIQRAETAMSQISSRPHQQRLCSEASKRAKMSRPHEGRVRTCGCPCSTVMAADAEHWSAARVGCRNSPGRSFASSCRR